MNSRISRRCQAKESLHLCIRPKGLWGSDVRSWWTLQRWFWQVAGTFDVHAESRTFYGGASQSRAAETDATPLQSLKIIIQIKNLHLRAAIKINILLHINVNVFITAEEKLESVAKDKKYYASKVAYESVRREKPSRHDLRRLTTVLLVGILSLSLGCESLPLVGRSRTAVIWCGGWFRQ